MEDSTEIGPSKCTEVREVLGGCQDGGEAARLGGETKMLQLVRRRFFM
jgi:hypothetical protein